MSDETISPLRRRMIVDMTVRGFKRRRATTTFATSARSRPSSAARRTRRLPRRCAASSCIKHQTESGVGAPSINSAVSALRFLFSVTLDRSDLARRLTVVRQPRKLPLVLSVAEVALLIEAAPGSKYQAALHGLWRRAARRRGGRA